MSPSINPDRIVLAREARGQSQSELAASLKISQAKLSRMEAGLAPVREDLLPSLAEALNYPEGFFFLTWDRHGFGPSEIFHHRKRQTLPSKTLRRVHAQLEILTANVSKLLEATEIGAPPFPKVELGDFNNDPSAVARALRASWHLPPGPVKNLTQTIENAGGIVIRCDFQARLIDAVTRWLPGLPPMFFVNREMPGDRLRYSLAHELGHVVMHQIENAEMEEQANIFAAEFLMPREDVRPQLSPVTLEKLATLKPYWKVSMAALLYRATELGRISERQKRSLWMRLGAAGYRTREPAELDVPTEEPSLLREIVSAHFKDLGYTLAELARMLAVPESDVLALQGLQVRNLRAVQ